MQSQRNTNVSYLFSPHVVSDEANEPDIAATDSDDLFTRPTRVEAREVPSIATTAITCRVCGATVTVPILHPGLLCYQCERNPQTAQEQAYNQWEQAQLRAMELDRGQPDSSKRVYTRYMNVVEARYFASTEVLTRFLQFARQPRIDSRHIGSSARTDRIGNAICNGFTDEAIIASEQARVARGIEKTLAAGDGLADLLRAEQRYNDALDAIESVMGV
jgi:hypothetical protein